MGTPGFAAEMALERSSANGTGLPMTGPALSRANGHARCIRLAGVVGRRNAERSALGRELEGAGPVV